ncbi:uncharacterized protein LOC112506242 [Cynara cardunculus var. scolymus]|uniref:uncharacterized protein LOC112506242 n=1 Tax=Cynara cardunculus var. scolymus TaxID=59895 RepID=UPI000D62A10B|nr:uncharacterized protein LOC112506242 [Cynara cardunculus var. scolymus]
MDTLYGISNSKVPKRSSLSSINNFGPQNPFYHHTGPMLDPYASPEGHTTVLKDLNSPFLRYLQSARSLFTAPVSAGDHLPSAGYKYHRSSHRSAESSSRFEPPRQSRAPLLFSNTPVKVEEDVLVMDGVLVKNPPVDRGRSLSSLSLTDSGVSSSSSGKDYKMDLCLSYLENSGFCRYGLKCQFAHGNKELRPSPFSFRTTLETPCKNYNVSGSCSFGSKCHFLHHETSAAPSQTVATSTTRTISPIKLDEPATSTVNLKSTEWSPLDDDIEIPAPTNNTPSKEDVEALITKAVYGPSRIKRLPVFGQICPE